MNRCASHCWSTQGRPAPATVRWSVDGSPWAWMYRPDVSEMYVSEKKMRPHDIATAANTSAAVARPQASWCPAGTVGADPARCAGGAGTSAKTVLTVSPRSCARVDESTPTHRHATARS